ncbi:MAG: hypothetical protein K6G28_03320, partial [Acholeplasmatales bacterium]|nr:hypothetical protein [Acholeplasmatales bacterium]
MGHRTIYLHVLIAILFLVSIGAVIYALNKRKQQAEYNNIFNQIKENLNNIINIYYKDDSFYDIYAETTYAKYYFKIITNT